LKFNLEISRLAELATSQEHLDELEERAAIIEFDGGFTRSKAELLAAQETGQVKSEPSKT